MPVAPVRGEAASKEIDRVDDPSVDEAERALERAQVERIVELEPIENQETSLARASAGVERRRAVGGGDAGSTATMRLGSLPSAGAAMTTSRSSERTVPSAFRDDLVAPGCDHDALDEARVGRQRDRQLDGCRSPHRHAGADALDEARGP